MVERHSRRRVRPEIPGRCRRRRARSAAQKASVPALLRFIVSCFYSILFEQIILDKELVSNTLRTSPPFKIRESESVNTMNVQQAIADFLQHGQAVRNLSDRTIRAYQSDLSQFNVHVHDANMV